MTPGNPQPLASDSLRNHEYALAALESVTDAVIAVDASARVEYMNSAAQRLTCWDVNAASGRPVREVLNIRRDAGLDGGLDPVAACMAQRSPVSGRHEHGLEDREGRWHDVEFVATPVCMEDEVAGAVVVLRDVGFLGRLERRVAWQAEHDALTGLPNRPHFERRLELALESARCRGEAGSVICIDLDRFKGVNDLCGHAAGDRVLREVGGLLRVHLRRELRAGAVLARLGGDEFGVILPKGPDDAGDIAALLRSAIESHRFDLDGRHIAVSASFGVVEICRACGGLARVLRDAENACRLAKEYGGNRVFCPAADDRQLRARREEMEWASRIREAIDEERLVLHGQPIVPLGGVHPAHVEILVRVREEHGALLPPGAWLGAAERYGLMPEIDRWVVGRIFERVGRGAAPWAHEDGFCAINLSSSTLCEPSMLDYVRTRLSAREVDPRNVCFEITESAVIADPRCASRFIAELKALGVRFALDDFGMGANSLAQLKSLPVDFLKIDGSFVRRIAIDPVDHAMVEAVHRLGRSMNLRTVAEYAENDAILERLRAMGVDFAQGYGISEPLPLDAWKGAWSGCAAKWDARRAVAG